MKPKYSTGYLTPQTNRVRQTTQPRLSESHENLAGTMDINDSLFENLMSCPIKRQLVLNLIASEKDNIEKFKKKEDKKKKMCNESPLSKVQRRHQCESPTALLRRRALEQQDRQSPVSGNQSDDKSRSSSRQSDVLSAPSPIPFNKLLDGVTAYVEIKSKDEKDRSKGAKALLQSMGAVLRDKFTKDVTHVIFKDGSFATYQKAKLMKVHLVSVLWIEAVRSSNTKVSEKKFPALGTEAYDHNVSSLCSQMQKDYEEIIRDELRRSLATGTPLPSTQSFIDRRRTTMTPMPSTSKFCSQEFQSSQDREVYQIMQHRRKTNNCDEAGAGSPLLSHTSPEITDDESDLTPFINGSIINRKDGSQIHIPIQAQVIINTVENLGDYSTSSMELTNTDSSSSPASGKLAARKGKKSEACGSSMDLTTLGGRLIIDESDDSTKENDLPNTSDDSIYYKKTPKLKSKKSLGTNFTPKKSTDKLVNNPDDSIDKRRTHQLRSNVDVLSDNSTNVSSEVFLKEKSDHSFHSAMSTSQLSHQVQILSKNACTTNTEPLQMQQEDLVTSSIQVSTEKLSSIAEKSTSTNMSSLHISDASNKDKVSTVNKVAEKSSSTNMSTLQISDSNKDKESTVNKVTEKSSSTNMSMLYISDSNKDKESTVDNVTEKSSSTNMSKLHVSSTSNRDKEDIVNKVAEKSSSTNMSMLLISSDSIKNKSNRSTHESETESNNNFIKINGKNKSNNKTSLNKKLNLWNSSNTSVNNSFSPLNPDVIKDIFNTLEESPLPDHNVTRRRGQYSANSSITNVSGRKTVQPDDNIIDSTSSRKSKKVLQEEASPSKKLKADSKSEQVAAKTPKKDSRGSDGNTRRSLRTQTSNTRSEPDFKSKKALEHKSRSKTSSNDSQSATESSGSDKKGKKLRKLYNPDKSIEDVIDSDEQEREDKRTKVREQKSDKGVFLNPNVVCVSSNILLTAKAKAFVDKNNIDVESVLNKELDDSKQDKTSAKAKNKDKGKRISVNSDADEQQELAEEFINKKKNNKSSSAAKKLISNEGKVVKRRQSTRLSQHPKKNINLDSTISSPDEKLPKGRKSTRLLQHPRKELNFNSSTSSSDETIIPIIPVVNRRSTMEFQTLSQTSAKKRLKLDKNKRPSIVCTKMHRDQIQVFNQIVRKLGGFVIEDEVSCKTTHLVAGEPKRTINMLRAIAMGCWILKHEWLLASLEEGRWLPEEDYEEIDFSPAVQQCRLQRQAFGPSYSMDIFQHCEPIYVAKGSIPRCSDLKELVILCKGTIVTSIRNAGIVVGELVRNEGVQCVKETWILDSITYNKKMPLRKYIIPTNNNSLIV